MSKFSVQADFQRDAGRLRAARAKLPAARKAGMRSVGVQVIAWAVRDFRGRSTGGSQGGTTWRRIGRSAIASRLAKRSPWQAIGTTLAAMTAVERPLRENMARMMPGSGTRQQRGAIAHAFEEANPIIKTNKAKRKKLKAKRKSMIDSEFARHAIGVDTGRLVNSLVWGEPELAGINPGKMRPGTPPPPRAEFKEGKDSITVGSNLEYAKHFDKIRPVFPRTMITPARKKELQELLADVQDEVIRESYEGKA